jgi:CBS domain-containing protein
MNIQEPLVESFMTLQPQTVEGKENIETARKMMSKFGIHHLPVVTDGIVVGILSEREANLSIGIGSIDPKRLLVIDVCSEKPYIVHPDTPLREVADVMAREHFGSAMVMENAHLVGIFTTVDACRALHDLLEETIEESNLESIRNFRFFLRSLKSATGKED